MSAQQLTYEGLLEVFRESDRRFNEKLEKQSAEFRQLMKERDAEYEKIRLETDRQMKETDRKISALGSRIGEIVENMLGARILDKFQALGYEVDDYTRNYRFRNTKLGISGEIDLILLDGDVAILIEVKTKLETADVRRHLERMEEFRRHADAAKILWPPSTRFIGAVAGAVVSDEAERFAHENGLYTIVQSGEGVEIVEVPADFQARVW